jgi:hypothetical protein
MMTKWDTIQADVADAYTYLDEEEAYNNALNNEDVEDVFGFSKAIEIDHLTDEQLDMIGNMFETREAD